MMMQIDPHALKALLDWQAELGADEPMGETPVDRYALPKAQTVRGGVATTVVAAPVADPVAEATVLAAGAGTLEELRAALAGYSHCQLRQGARTLVFCDGLPGARVMILGDAPGRDEDLQGLPFAGREGQLLDRMLAAIGLSRRAPDPAAAVYLSCVLPWRPPQNRPPTPDEIAMMVPFALRHVELAQPDLLVLMGNLACEAMMGRKGIAKLRGGWCEVAGLPTLPMLSPAYLLRTPQAKREAWADLLSLRARLNEVPLRG